MTTTTVTTAGSGLIFNLSWDASVGAAPSAFQTDVVAAARFIESLITNAVTVNLNVGYGEVGGSSLGGALGASIVFLGRLSYAGLVADLKATASTDGTDAAMIASLPATDPTGKNNYLVSSAQEKAVGASPANAAGTDGDVGFATSNHFTFGDTNSSGTVAAGTYDFFATAVHEITETMGRINLAGDTSIDGSAAYSLMDLTHYSAPGVRQLTQSNGGAIDPGGYASPDGGKTNIDNFNAVAGGDAGDLAQPGPDALNAFARSGVLMPFTANDATLMDMIGWNLSGTGSSPPPPPPPQAPTGITIAPLSTALASLQSSAGLAAGHAIAAATEVGGVGSDSYTYTLGGPNAAAFTLSSAGMLSTGGTAVAGAAGGRLYAITITANDTTIGTKSPAVPVNVVVGSSNYATPDTIHLSTIGGISTSSPTFVYGLAGSDTIDGTGMSGRLFFDGGVGADRMTGGSGPNRYEYGVTTDSTNVLMDVITNFNAAQDAIDLTGIGRHLATVGALSAGSTSIGAQSAGWLVNGGNTFLYVNTTTGSQTLAKANMEIELQGNIPLTAGSILHV